MQDDGIGVGSMGENMVDWISEVSGGLNIWGLTPTSSDMWGLASAVGSGGLIITLNSYIICIYTFFFIRTKFIRTASLKLS